MEIGLGLARHAAFMPRLTEVEAFRGVPRHGHKNHITVGIAGWLMK